MSWWKKEPESSDLALSQAAMRLRMVLNNLNSGSVTKVDRAWAAVLADSLETSGYILVRAPAEPLRGPTER